MYKERNILLGVTGGIAAYKAVELLRLLIKEGAQVWTLMTAAATKFVGPMTFQALSGHSVRTDLFSSTQEREIEHVALGDMADLAIVAPATANLIGKIANGIADDMLTTTLLVVRCPLVVCPAMNVNMYAHPAVQENLGRLRSRGVRIVEPQEGELACGWEGKGRLADLETILEAGRSALSPQDLEGEHLLVTAGPTWECLDPVRFLSNRSSGKMGYAIAQVGLRRGARVTLVSGPSDLTPPHGARFVPVTSAQEMHEAVMAHLGDSTAVLKAAAVVDYRPTQYWNEKIKKTDNSLTLDLERTPDILAEIGERKEGRLLIGFAAETQDLIKHAKSKLQSKNLDWIIANDITKPGAGFGTNTNQVSIIDRNGEIEELPMMDKEQVACAILDRIARRRQRGSND